MLHIRLSLDETYSVRMKILAASDTKLIMQYAALGCFPVPVQVKSVHA